MNDVVFPSQANLILPYVIKIPSNLVRLAKLGPSADTSAKKEPRFTINTTAVWEVFGQTSLKEMCKIQFQFFQENSEPVDLQHKN